jgi:hypothetical protein
MPSRIPGRSAALALVATLAATGTAHADVQLFTALAGRFPSSEGLLFGTKTVNFGFDEFRLNELEAFNGRPNVSTGFMIVDAFVKPVRGPAPFLNTFLEGDLQGARHGDFDTRIPIAGSGSSGLIASATATDTVQVLGVDPDDHRQVILHKVLQFGADQRESLTLNDGFDDNLWNVGVSAQTQVTGDGIGSSQLGGSLYASLDFARGNDGTRFHFSRAQQGVVDFALPLELGTWRTFSVGLRSMSFGAMNEDSGGSVDQFNYGIGANLTWGRDSFLTDAVTGEVLHGYEINSSSGFDYAGRDTSSREGLIAALPSATPEPAAWALMLGGFGLAGVVLRRRREDMATA